MDDAELDELDHQVAAALGGVLDGDGWRFDPPLDFLDGGHFIKTKRSFCRDWSYGGPIIEARSIQIYRNELRDASGRFRDWVADCPASVLPVDGGWLQRKSCGFGTGTTPLVAAMRALVATSPTQQP